MADDPYSGEIRKILWDFYHSYPVDGDGTDSLQVRLHRQYADPQQQNTVKTRSKPHPAVPGDITALSIAEETTATITYWLGKIHPTGGAGLGLDDTIRLLPVLAAGHRHAAEILADLRSLHGQALVTLGLRTPPRPLRGLPCPACGHTTLVFDPEVSTGDVWCSNSGPSGCHDDVRWPECREPSGLLSCRRSDGSQRHAMRWGHGQLGMLGRAS